MQMIQGLDIDAFLGWARDPFGTQDTFRVQTALMTAENRAKMLKCMTDVIMAQPTFVEIYDERYNPPLSSQSELLAYPEGSLGRLLGIHLQSNQIEMDFAGLDTSMFYRADTTAVSYLAARSLRCHDIFHVVLGLTTSPIDEYKLFSFQLAQYPTSYHAVLMAGAYLQIAFYRPSEISLFLDAMSDYRRIGQRARFFPGYKFEERWSLPIGDVRAELNVSLDLEPSKRISDAREAQSGLDR